jgi:hypothetical protein
MSMKKKQDTMDVVWNNQKNMKNKGKKFRGTCITGVRSVTKKETAEEAPGGAHC